MSYYRRLPTDVRVAMFITRNATWFKRAIWSAFAVVTLALTARAMGLGS